MVLVLMIAYLVQLIFTFLTEFVSGCLAGSIFLFFLVANSSKYLTPSNFACFCNNSPRVHLAWLAVIAHSKTHYSVILDKAFFFFSCVIPPNLSYCIVVSIKWLRERLLFIPSSDGSSPKKSIPGRSRALNIDLEPSPSPGPSQKFDPEP